MTYFIITGATGDLARTKLYPALAEMFSYGQYIGETQFIGAGRKPYTQEEYQQLVRDSLGIHDWKLDFIDNLHYIQLDFDTILTIQNFIRDYDIQKGDRIIWYMAIPPQAFGNIITTLSDIKQQYKDIEYTLVFEKPFGSDIISAKALNNQLAESFREEEIYRIDHYLGKETIQNILALRFGNTMFEPLLNNHYVESISINVWEERGINERAEYFDNTGIIKDILQNHILQTLALITMEAPVAMEAEYIRDEKHKILNSLRPIQSKDIILGQYISSGDKKSYLEETGVPTESKTETYIALTAYIDNLRWENTPIYISTGKRLSETKAEIRIKFKQSFNYFSHIDEGCNPQQNELVISIQPNEEVYYTVNAKFPGKGMCIQPVKLNFTYEESFGQRSQGAYTRLIQDIIEQDQSLFIRADEIEAAWNYVDALIQSNTIKERQLVFYEAGSNPNDIKLIQSMV